MKCDINKAGDDLYQVVLLAIRIILAYGFYITAIEKVSGIENVAAWFGGMGVPFPLLNAYLATITELVALPVLIFGIFLRPYALILIFLLLVAIFLVHFKNGFSVGSNGFEIPLYYILFLLVFVAKGAGRISVDYLVIRKKLPWVA